MPVSGEIRRIMRTDRSAQDSGANLRNGTEVVIWQALVTPARRQRFRRTGALRAPSLNGLSGPFPGSATSAAGC